MCAGHPSPVHLRGALGFLLLNLFRPSVDLRWAPLACTPEGCPGAFVGGSISPFRPCALGTPPLYT
eukprot:scaffold63920_cov51-Phaeocystis_antarctica.AAC.2